ncbi:MAG TPA: hypothetical protein VIJ22_15375, partial [Polyangiaceae bacterium]
MHEDRVHHPFDEHLEIGLRTTEVIMQILHLPRGRHERAFEHVPVLGSVLVGAPDPRDERPPLGGVGRHILREADLGELTTQKGRHQASATVLSVIVWLWRSHEPEAN